MPSEKICLASDNWSPAHPKVMQAVLDANRGYAASYGADEWTEKAVALLQKSFRTKCRVLIIPTGTGANVLALKLACRRFESVLCTDIAHIQYQESGAFESIVGCKLLTVGHKEGKVVPDALEHKIKKEKAFGRHSTSPRVLSITQPTELGTVYTLEELEALSKLCKKEHLLFHIDGSRLYNAAVSLNVELHEITAAAQPDLLSLGGTKNGLMGVEALFILNAALEPGSDYLHKQTLQLSSKMRYLSAQYIPFFEERLWHSLALQANQKAQEISASILSNPSLSLSHPVETNQIFFTAPSSWVSLIQEKIFCYVWAPEERQIRFIASWNTSKEELQSLRSFFASIAS